jgi:phosphonatase-like hydrolase
MSVELIVFDLAGTTVKDNEDVHRTMKNALSQHGVEISINDANAVMGLPKPQAIRMLLDRRYHGGRPITEDWIASIHDIFVRDMISFYKSDPSVGEMSGVNLTFRKLREHKLKVFVDTGFDRQITDPLIDRLGWKQENLIDGSVTSDEVKRGRPFPDLIFRAMELTRTKNPGNVAKVGDTASDMQEGIAAGCGWVIGITTGSNSRAELLREKHTHLIEDVSEVLEILNINID